MTPTLETVFTDADVFCDETVRGVDTRPKVARLTLYIIAGGALYGFGMGLSHSFAQAFASAIKVPTLLFVTLIICFPSLHFLGLLFGSRMRFTHSFSVLIFGLATTSILLSAFAPIALFFLVTGSKYDFLLLMHVAIFAFSGLAGLQAIRRDFGLVSALCPAATSPRSYLLLRAWMLLYMFVGAQMAHAIAPFVGSKSDFLLFRHPEGNFFTEVMSAIGKLLY